MKNDSLNFMELTCLIKILSEYIDRLKHERDREGNEISDKTRNRISREIKCAEEVKYKLENIWMSRIRIR